MNYTNTIHIHYIHIFGKLINLMIIAVLIQFAVLLAKRVTVWTSHLC